MLDVLVYKVKHVERLAVLVEVEDTLRHLRYGLVVKDHKVLVVKVLEVIVVKDLEMLVVEVRAVVVLKVHGMLVLTVLAGIVVNH